MIELGNKIRKLQTEIIRLKMENQELQTAKMPVVMDLINELENELADLLFKLGNISSNEQLLNTIRLGEASAETIDAAKTFEALKSQVLNTTEIRLNEIQNIIKYLKDSRTNLNDVEDKAQAIAALSARFANAKEKLTEEVNQELEHAIIEYNNNIKKVGLNKTITIVPEVQLIEEVKNKKRKVISSNKNKKWAKAICSILVAGGLAGGIFALGYALSSCDAGNKKNDKTPNLDTPKTTTTATATPYKAPSPTATPTATVDPTAEEQKLCREIADTLYKTIIANNNDVESFENNEKDVLKLIYILRGYSVTDMNSEEIYDYINDITNAMYNIQATVAYNFYSDTNYQLTKYDWIEIFENAKELDPEDIRGLETLDLQSKLTFAVLTSKNIKDLKTNAAELVKFCEVFYLNRDNVFTDSNGIIHQLTGFDNCGPIIKLLLHKDALNALVIADTLDGNIKGYENTIRDVVNDLYPVIHCEDKKNAKEDYSAQISADTLFWIEKSRDGLVIIEIDNGKTYTLKPGN